MRIDTLKFKNSNQFSFVFTELYFSNKEEQTNTNKLGIYTGEIWKNKYASITLHLSLFEEVNT
jgi:hypothetical protein